MIQRQLTIALVFLSMSIWSVPANAATEPPLNSAANDTIRALKLDKADNGIYAIDAKTGDVLVEVDPDLLLNPASNVKIVTAAVALKELGGDYLFHTYFSTDAMDGRGAIKNLYIKGTGDPFLVTEAMDRMVVNLIKRGVTRITGDIVVDEGFFGGTTREQYEDNKQPYTAPNAATSLNFNSVNVIVDRKGAGYEIQLDAPNDFITIENRLKPTGRGVAVVRKPTKLGDTVVVSGGLPKGANHYEEYVNISNPALYLGSAFKTCFNAHAVLVDGKVREGKTGGTIQLTDEKSKQLREIIDDMNRFSNNFVAEQLTKHIGAVKVGEPGSTSKGIREFEKYLATLGIKKGSYTLVNGSGLSHDNRMTARQLVRVLKDAYDDPAIRNDYLNSLSVAGVKGTIKNRHKGPLLNGKLLGKTGSLNGVSTLTGFVPMRNGHTAVFAILTNGPVGLASTHRLQDDVATLLASYR